MNVGDTVEIVGTVVGKVDLGGGDYNVLVNVGNGVEVWQPDHLLRVRADAPAPEEVVNSGFIDGEQLPQAAEAASVETPASHLAEDVVVTLEPGAAVSEALPVQPEGTVTA